MYLVEMLDNIKSYRLEIYSYGLCLKYHFILRIYSCENKVVYTRVPLVDQLVKNPLAM